MTIEHPTLHACLEQLKAEGFPEALPATLPDPCHGLLVDPEAIRELVAAVATRDVPVEEAMGPETFLLGRLLDEARQGMENGKAHGEDLLAAAAEAMEAHNGQATHAGVLALARAYTHADREPPEALLHLRDALGPPAGPMAGAEAPTDPTEGLRDLLQEGREDPHGLYMSLSEVLATQSREERHGVVYGLASLDEGATGELALYWLLDRDPAIRRAAAQGLLDRARGGTLDSRTAARLPLLRSWLPADEARGLVDSALREARRANLGGEPFPEAGMVDEGAALLPDGVGTLYLMMPVTAPDGTPMVAMVLTRAGHGLKDAHLMPDTTLADMRAHLADMPGGAESLVPLNRDTFRELTAAALGEGLAADRPPAPTLMDVVAALGLADLRPASGVPEDWLARVDPEGELAGLTPQKRGRLINRSREWPRWHPMLTTWFEDTPEVREILAAGQGHRHEQRQLRQYLETRRAFWAEQCLKTARILKDTAAPDHWRSFAAAGAALLEGRDLKRVPIMEEVLVYTREAHGGGAEEAHTEEASGFLPGVGDVPLDLVFGDEPEPADLSGLGWSEEQVVWVEGFLMAVVTAPRRGNIRKWMSVLLAALPEPEDEAEGEAVLDELQACLDDLQVLIGPDSEESPALPAEDTLMRHWAAGFHHAVQSGTAGWIGRKYQREDRRMLEVIKELANGQSPYTNAASLVRQWLAARSGL
ncbi:MAG: UPF0149 family protein [Pseudomonadota bacterium]